MMFTSDDIIYTYTRKQAIEDGLQVSLSDWPETAEAAQQLYKYPVYLTSGVVNLVELAISNEKHHNDFNGVLWDILWMSVKASQPISQEASRFKVIITGAGRKRYHKMIASCGPTDIDDPTPCITIMLPEEW